MMLAITLSLAKGHITSGILEKFRPAKTPTKIAVTACFDWLPDATTYGLWLLKGSLNGL